MIIILHIINILKILGIQICKILYNQLQIIKNYKKIKSKIFFYKKYKMTIFKNNF